MRCDLGLLLDRAKALAWMKDGSCYLVDGRIGVYGNRVANSVMGRASRIWKGIEPEDLPLIAAGTNWGNCDVEEKLIARGAERALERGLR